MVKVVFIHPDLGIGGAERAMIDAALALQSKNHEVHFVTAHHDPKHCFEETRNGTVSVTVAGDWMPRSIFGRCYALCAYIRMIYAATYLVFFSGLDYNIVFCDQISACIPMLKLSKNAKILFYCHFPDMLLTQRQSILKKLYRTPIDWLEEKTTGMADVILVNSKFTGSIFKNTFKSLQHIDPEVLYPIPDVSSFNKPIDPPTESLIPNNKKIIFLSINRYERKKNLALAVRALGKLKAMLDDTTFKGIHLVMAGGYDERVTENVEHYLELRKVAHELELNEYVTFVRSFSDSQKRTLLHYSSCLLYTPDKEHFGIVPVEAMYMKCPVIAVKSGGPLETVADGISGFLCEPNEKSFADAMYKFVTNPKLRETMGQSGNERVIEKFSFKAFTNQLHSVVEKLVTY